VRIPIIITGPHAAISFDPGGLEYEWPTIARTAAHAMTAADPPMA